VGNIKFYSKQGKRCLIIVSFENDVTMSLQQLIK